MNLNWFSYVALFFGAASLCFSVLFLFHVSGPKIGKLLEKFSLVFFFVGFLFLQFFGWFIIFRSHQILKNKYKKIIAGNGNITRLMTITRINNDAETAWLEHRDALKRNGPNYISCIEWALEFRYVTSGFFFPILISRECLLRFFCALISYLFRYS